MSASVSQENDVRSLSQVLFAIRPWSHEQDMMQLTTSVVNLQINGVLWGANTTEDVGYGVRDLLITAVIDENVISLDEVMEYLLAQEDMISQVNIRLWNKVQ